MNALICSFSDISSGCQLPNPKGPLSSASIKAANEAVHAGRFETTEGVTI